MHVLQILSLLHMAFFSCQGLVGTSRLPWRSSPGAFIQAPLQLRFEHLALSRVFLWVYLSSFLSPVLDLYCGGLVSKCLFRPVPCAVALAPDCFLDLILLLTDGKIRGKQTADHTYVLVMLWSVNLSLGLILKGRYIDYIIMKDFLFLLCFFLHFFSWLCFLSIIVFSF